MTKHGYDRPIVYGQSDWRKALRLKQAPNIRILQGVPRRMSEVDETLVRVFRDLVSGALPWPLFLYGGVGTGKTFAALSLADFVLSAAYRTVEQMCDEVMTGASLEFLKDKDLLVLDELGERTETGSLRYTTVKRVLDSREMYACRVAVYISNLPPSKLAEPGIYDDRVVSRLTAGTVFKLDGSDRRSM